MRVLYVFLVVVIGLVSCNEAVDSEATEASVQETTQVKEANVGELVSTEETTEQATKEEKEEVKEEIPKPIEKKAAPAKPKVPAKKPARMVFNSKGYEYGTIEQGDKFSHEFIFTNKGESDLIIKNVKATCGCTQPTFPFMPIKPGKTGKIQVSYNSTGKLGAQRPEITVISNGYPRRQVLHLNGVVMPPRKIEPPVRTTPSSIDVAPVNNGNVSKGISTDTTGN